MTGQYFSAQNVILVQAAPSAHDNSNKMSIFLWVVGDSSIIQKRKEKKTDVEKSARLVANLGGLVHQLKCPLNYEQSLLFEPNGKLNTQADTVKKRKILGHVQRGHRLTRSDEH